MPEKIIDFRGRENCIAIFTCAEKDKKTFKITLSLYQIKISIK